VKVNGKRTLDKTSIANSTIGLSLQNQTISLRNRVWKAFDNRRIGKYRKVEQRNIDFSFQTNQSEIDRETTQVIKNIKSNRSR